MDLCRELLVSLICGSYITKHNLKCPKSYFDEPESIVFIVIFSYMDKINHHGYKHGYSVCNRYTHSTKLGCVVRMVVDSILPVGMRPPFTGY